MMPFAKTANSRRSRSRFPLGLYRVSGESMLPTYKPDDLLLGWRWFRPRPGQTVVAQDRLTIIKRIEHIAGGQIWLSGDNHVLSSPPSQIAPDRLRALIIYRLKRA